jgi:putative tryptophan/tyrosine transport system substrate-binding protein
MRLAVLLFGLIVLAEPGFAEERVWRLGVLTPFDWPADTTMHTVMLPELARRGFVEGRNLIVLPRWGSNDDLDQLARLAQDLAAAKPDAIIAVGPTAIKATMNASPQTPIVASFSPDPVREGIAVSLARPGGEVTGIAMLAREGDAKRIELLHDAIPTARKFGMLVDQVGLAGGSEMQRAAGNAGVEIILKAASDMADYAPALDALHAAGVEGLVIQSSPVFHRDSVKLAALAAERHLPTICEWRSMAADGCMVGYGPDIAELRLRTADFIVRLFAGGNPAEMPFEQPTRFEMAINNKVAHSIGVTIPPSLYVRADEVIE